MASEFSSYFLACSPLWAVPRAPQKLEGPVCSLTYCKKLLDSVTGTVSINSKRNP